MPITAALLEGGKEMKVCPNCNHHIYDEILTVCPYCIEKLPTKKEKEEDSLISQLYERTRSGDEAANNFLGIVSFFAGFCGVILFLYVFLGMISGTITNSSDDSAFLILLLIGAPVAIYCSWIAMKLIGHMAQDMHTTASVNLLMLRYKIDEINRNQTRLTEAEKQEFLSEQTISEIRDEIDGIETQYKIAELEQELSERLKAKRKQELEQRYTARIKQASDSISPLENEIMGFYEQFLQIVDARKNPIEPAPSGRRRRQS